MAIKSRKVIFVSSSGIKEYSSFGDAAKKSLTTFLKSPTAVSLLLANLISFVLAVLFNWGIGVVLFLFWVQGIIIAFFGTLNIATSYFEKNKTKSLLSKVSFVVLGVFAAIFWLFFYSFYLLFIIFLSSTYDSNVVLMNLQNLSDPITISFLISVLIFILNHAFSYFYYRRREEYTFGNVMGRLIVLHVAIVLGVFVGLFLSLITGKGLFSIGILLVFFGLKLLFDLTSHSMQHGNN